MKGIGTGWAGDGRMLLVVSWPFGGVTLPLAGASD